MFSFEMPFSTAETSMHDIEETKRRMEAAAEAIPKDQVIRHIHVQCFDRKEAAELRAFAARFTDVRFTFTWLEFFTPRRPD